MLQQQQQQAVNATQSAVALTNGDVTSAVSPTQPKDTMDTSSPESQSEAPGNESPLEDKTVHEEKEAEVKEEVRIAFLRNDYIIPILLVIAGVALAYQ